MTTHTPKTVLICPDSFKGSLSAHGAAQALATGWTRLRPQDTIHLAPMADGGEGTHAAFTAAGSPDPIVELAELCGIETLDELQPHHAGTRPFGQAIAKALATSSPRLYLGIGGSASTDCGAGMLQGLGVSITDHHGHPIGPGLAGIAEATSIDFTPAADNLQRIENTALKVITDVTAPLTGPQGAAYAFGPQKGLTDDELGPADEIVARFAELLAQHAPHPAPPTTPGAGAAGGVGYALLSLGAQLLPGADHMAQALGIPTLITTADLVITGEGAFDATSLQGKVPATILGLANTAGVPCHLVAGTIRDTSLCAPFASAHALDRIAAVLDGDSFRHPSPYLIEAAARVVDTL